MHALLVNKVNGPFEMFLNFYFLIGSVTETVIEILCAELSIDIPPESPLASPKKSKKRKAKDSGGSRDKKAKRSKPKSGAKGDKAAEVSYDDGSDGDDEPIDVCFFVCNNNTMYLICWPV